MAFQSVYNQGEDTRMKATLYLLNSEKPVAVLDDVNLITMDDNHKTFPDRITYKSKKLNASKTMIELHRDEKMRIMLEDGRQGSVILQHTSLDMEGNAVGVLRLLGSLSSQAAA
jgi:hypothetical protein